MATTLTATGIQFPDLTTQTTAATGGGGGTQATTFTSSGTFTIPSGITALKVTVVGGGAGGVQGVGGSSAGVAIKYLTGLTSGNTLSVTIGAGGPAGTGSVLTSTGGNSSVASGSQSITTIQANGGVTGGATPGGGTTSGADIGITGGRNNTGQVPGRDTMYGVGGAPATATCCSTSAGTAGLGYGSGGGAGVGVGGFNGYAGAPGLVIFEY